MSYFSYAQTSDYKVIQRHDCGHPEETGRNEDLVVRKGESIIVVKEPQRPEQCANTEK